MGKRNDYGNEYLQGLEQVNENLQNEVDKIQQASVEGLLDALVFIGSESQQKAPVDTGDLRGSLRITLDGTLVASGLKGQDGATTYSTNIPETAEEGEASYNTDYAADQHEQLDYFHPNGGEAKYLEKVILNPDNQKRILAMIAGKIISEMEDF